MKTYSLFIPFGYVHTDYHGEIRLLDVDMIIEYRKRRKNREEGEMERKKEKEKRREGKVKEG